MKKSLFLFGVVLLFTVGCHNNKKKAETAVSKADSLQMILKDKDSILNDALLSISEISSTLNEIRRRENIITATSGNPELTRESKEVIREDLAAINGLLVRNRETIVRLQNSVNQLNRAHVNTEGLNHLVSQLQEQIHERDLEIATLTSHVAKLNIEVGTLTENVQQLTTAKTRLERENKELYTAYYIVGTEKELMDKEIIDKKGFLINRTAVINPNIDKSQLVEIDIRDVNRIDIGGKKAKVLGGHPQSSYELIEYDNYTNAIIITDYRTFWENSKILVIAYR